MLTALAVRREVSRDEVVEHFHESEDGGSEHGCFEDLLVDDGVEDAVEVLETD